MDTALLVALVSAGSLLLGKVFEKVSDTLQGRKRITVDAVAAERLALQAERDADRLAAAALRDELRTELALVRGRVAEMGLRLDACEKAADDAHKASQIAYAERDEWRQRFIDLEAKVAGLEP